MQNIYTVKKIIDYGAKLFKQNKLTFFQGTDNPFDDAAALVAHVLKLDFITNEQLDRDITKIEQDAILNLYDQRIKKKIPVVYLTNKAYFGGYEFYIDERVLIPRSPMAESILNKFSPWLETEPQRMLDLCTGSGCLGILCALIFDKAKVDITDISNEALEVAQINIKRHQLEKRVMPLLSNMFDDINESYDVIVSNPPYVPAEEYATLPDEFTHEPKDALVTNDHGLYYAKKILHNASKYLNEKGILILEVGHMENELEKSYPNVPFIWLHTQDEQEGILMMTKQDLIEYFID